jgi:enoyl-CoA hydratase
MPASGRVGFVGRGIAMIEVERRDEVSIVRMVRGKGNALNLDLLDAMAGTLESLEHNDARAGVITGQGNVFGAGVDLPELLAGGESYLRLFLPRMIEVFRHLATFRKPMVAAINGHAIAGGAIVALACDQRLLARGPARVGLTEVLVGVQFPSWALEIARHSTPPEHFSTLILTGRTWQGEEALARGLVDELVDPEQLLDRACEVANEMGAVPAETFTATKLAVRRPMIEAAQRESASNATVLNEWCSPDTLANIAAFAERNIKRKS